MYVVQSSEKAKTSFLMQFTCFKDKNNNDIYEGDLLNNRGSIYEVVYDKASFKLKSETHKATFTEFLEQRVTTHFEVIGNIYETKPETIKQ